ncbi:MAG: type II toxin-antitoxin system VapC family toxin [Terracidiphilus sp.]
MRILLDTHILLWWFYERERLTSTALEIVRDAEAVFFSSATMWEIAIKVRLGKLRADPQELAEGLHRYDFLELPVLTRHALIVARLPMHHNDPFDRLLVSQAMSEPLHLVTADPRLRQYSDLVIQV